MSKSGYLYASGYPDDRMHPAYPWSLWAVGWLLILKAFVWLSTEPNVADGILEILGYKYLLFMVPSLVFGLGIWRKKKWAVWGALIISLLELVFFFGFPDTLQSLQLDHTSPLLLVFSAGLFCLNGPVSDVVAVIAVPLMVAQLRK